MFGDEYAEIYDLTYRQRGKDYAAEAARIAGLTRERHPAAATLLDVACGTGEHLRHFRDHFGDVAGLDGSAFMLERAREKLPGTPLYTGDMCDFDLGRTFDVVTCLFSSIGYLKSTDALGAATVAMARHLSPGGVLVVEPLWFPESFQDGYVASDLLRENGRTLARLSHSTRDGRTVRMDIHHLLADAEGIRHFVEHQTSTLFTKDEYLTALAAAGCVAEHVPGGRGLFLAVRKEH